MSNFITKRFLSLFFSITTILLPFGLYYFGFYNPSNKFDILLSAFEYAGLIAITILLMGVVSLAGFIFGIFAYKTIPRPRPILRKIEIVAIGILFLLIFATIIFNSLWLFGINI
jgi:hypothetical protein